MGAGNIVTRAMSSGIRRPMLQVLPSGTEYAEHAQQSDIWLLEHSGVFDANAYRALARTPGDGGAAWRYLTEGGRHGVERGPDFEGSFLFPCYRSVGFSGPPALSYITLVAAGGLPELTTHARAAEVADVVRHSE